MISLYALQHSDRNSQIFCKSEQSYCIAIGSCGRAVLSSQVNEYKHRDAAIYIW
jgi:hypothetical protein